MPHVMIGFAAHRRRQLEIERRPEATPGGSASLVSAKTSAMIAG